ncbi:MAG TPA: hypothetical protein VOA87_04190 [Thermoanaerobaculia bacterium]|nr:hypothetical protein [Thermoanaerobaculia bacterium]
MKRHSWIASLGGLTIALLLAGCAAATKTPNSAAARQPVHVEGVLTDNGIGCDALQGADGRMYTFARGLEGPKKGQRVWVDGYVADGKGCMSSTHVMPQRAGLIDETIAGTTH